MKWTLFRIQKRNIISKTKTKIEMEKHFQNKKSKITFRKKLKYKIFLNQKTKIEFLNTKTEIGLQNFLNPKIKNWFPKSEFLKTKSEIEIQNFKFGGTKNWTSTWKTLTRNSKLSGTKKSKNSKIVFRNPKNKNEIRKRI